MTTAEYSLPPRVEILEEQMASTQNLAGAGAMAASIASNRVQQVAAGGAVVAPGAAITLDATLTTRGPTGKIRVSAHFSGQVPATATCTALLQVAIAAGAFVTQVPFAQFTAVAGAPGEVADGIVFEFDSASPAGTALHVHWQTSGTDGALTLAGGGVAGPIAACLLVEELP